MKWITNVFVGNAEKYIQDLTYGQRILVTGDPISTQSCSKEQLVAYGVVGIYEVQDAEGTQTEGL